MVDSGTYLPQDITRRQKMAEALLYGAMKPRAIHNVGEGIAQMGQALLGGIMERKANEAEATGRKSASDAVARALAGIGSTPQDAAPTSTSVPQATSSTPPQTSTVTPDKEQFLASLSPAAQEVGQQTGVDPRIILAQAALETGWGKSAPGNNYFGIKSHGKPGGNTLATTEVVNGQPVQEMASFRGYADPSESVRDYGNFLQSNPRYKPMLSAQGLDAQIAALGQSGYATDPDYASKIRSIATGLPPLNDGVDRGEMRGANPQSMTINPVQRGQITPTPDMTRPLSQNPDMASLATAQPAALNRNLPMAQALAAPNATAPVAIPNGNPMRSNQQQSAGDFARADARRRMAMAMSGGQMPSAPPPMAGNAPSAPVQQPSPAMGAPMAAAPQQAPQGAPQGGNRLQALMAAAQNPYLSPAQASVLNAAIKMEMERTAPQEPKIVTAPDGTILAINPRDTAHPQTVYRSGGYRPMTPEEKASFGVPADQAAFMGPDGKPQALGKGGITINNNPEASMFAGLPKDVRAEMFKRQGEAQDASDLVGVTNQGLQLLDAGAITGAGSTGRVAALKWAQTLGIPVPEDTAAAINNTEAYKAIMAKAVGKVIKNFGSGTGLSDADRQYAERLAGGDTTLNEPAIRRILGAGMTQAQQKIKNYEGMRDKVLGGDLGALLNVPEPQAYTPPAPQQQAEPGTSAPPAPGTVMDGYRFKGGDPADKNNWQQVY